MMKTTYNSCSPRRREGELITKNGLSYTPAQMLAMAERGIPVTTANSGDMSKFAESNPSWEVPLDRVRGVDPGTLWEHSQIIKQRAADSYNNKYKELTRK